MTDTEQGPTHINGNGKKHWSPAVRGVAAEEEFLANNIHPTTEGLQNFFARTGITEVLNSFIDNERARSDVESKPAIGVGIIEKNGQKVYVAALRWDTERLLPEKMEDAWVSKAVRVIYDPTIRAIQVAYLARVEDQKDKESGDDKKDKGPRVRWVDFGDPIGSQLGKKQALEMIKDVVGVAMSLTTGRTHDARKTSLTGQLEGNPGIGMLKGEYSPRLAA